MVFLSTSSSIATSPKKFLHHRTFIISSVAKRHWNWYMICLIPITIGKTGISLFKGPIGCVNLTSGKL